MGLSHFTCVFLVARPFRSQNFDLVTLTLTFDLLLEKLNLDHNFWTKSDRALILHISIPCDKTFLLIPIFFTYCPWPWLWPTFGKTWKFVVAGGISPVRTDPDLVFNREQQVWLCAVCFQRTASVTMCCSRQPPPLRRPLSGSGRSWRPLISSPCDPSCCATSHNISGLCFHAVLRRILQASGASVECQLFFFFKFLYFIENNSGK